MSNPLFVLAVLCALVALTEWLVQNTALKHFGSALLVIALTAVVANLGLIPAGSTPDRPVVVYDGIFAYVAPAAIFLLLLQVNLRDIVKAGSPMILLFGLGALGTAVGTIAGMWLLNGFERFGEHYLPLGGMLVGTYTGGGINFNALALHYGLVTEGALFGGAVAVDNIMTAVWMMTTIAVPRLLGPFWRRQKKAIDNQALSAADVEMPQDTETVSPLELGLLAALTFASIWISNLAANWLAEAGLRFPSIVIVSILALIAAQVPIFYRLKGPQLLGSFTVTLFLAVIGAFCDLAAMKSLGEVGVSLFLLISIIVLIHGLLTFGGAWLFNIDPEVASVASQANIGGAPSALALARSLDRSDLVLPAVLVGSLGYAVGTFLGLIVAETFIAALF